jgi:hypothetical protein
VFTPWHLLSERPHVSDHGRSARAFPSSFPSKPQHPSRRVPQTRLLIMQDGRPKSLFSSLSTRTLSAVPPPSQSYEPLVKSVLTRRTKSTIIPFSFLFTWVSLAVWRMWLEPSGIWTIFYLLQPSWSIGAWVVGVLPLLILRKSYLKGMFELSRVPSQLIRKEQYL